MRFFGLCCGAHPYACSRSETACGLAFVAAVQPPLGAVAWTPVWIMYRDPQAPHLGPPCSWSLGCWARMHDPRLPTCLLWASVSSLVTWGTSAPFGRALRSFHQGMPGHEGAAWMTLGTCDDQSTHCATLLTWELLSMLERRSKGYYSHAALIELAAVIYKSYCVLAHLISWHSILILLSGRGTPHPVSILRVGSRGRLTKGTQHRSSRTKGAD